MDSKDSRGFLIFSGCVVAGLLAIAGINLYQAQHSTGVPKALTYTAFLRDLDAGRVSRVVLAGQDIRGSFTAGGSFETYAPEDPGLIARLQDKGVSITALPAPAASPSWVTMLTAAGPLVLMLLLAVFLMRRMPGAAGTGGIGRARARRLAAAAGRVTFADVAGVDEARQGLAEIVDFLREPRTATRLGGRIPHGVLLVGPPGTGKTLLARAVAGEANVPFFSISGSDFVEMFVGIGAARVRDLFEQAKKSAPCIIFMDEIDAVGRRRGAGLGGGNDEREQTLNQLLVEMDGFESKDGVILIAATNRPDVLDPALRRPGRFDREVVVDHPDVRGREEILKVHVRGVPLGADVDLAAIARHTPGFSGADLMNLVNEAALLASRSGKNVVGLAEFEEARDTVTMGAQRAVVMSEQERRLTAYREGGRALVALLAPAADPVHKVTILTRGSTAGRVQQVPQQDQRALTLDQMTSRLAILMAGRAAEELVFGTGRITSATAPDIEQATKLARRMVTRWGVSETLGPVTYAEDQEEVFLGHSVARQQTISPQTAQDISAEVRRLIDEALGLARQILTTHRGPLETLARALLEQETLTEGQIRELLPALSAPALSANEQEPARLADAPRGARAV